jgi:hypothetical protein
MSKIIQPMGPLVARIKIEFDMKNQASVEGKRLFRNPKNGVIMEEAMPPLEVCARLSGLVGSTLAGILMEAAARKGAVTVVEGGAGDGEKTNH